MTLQIEVDLTAGVPPYEQIRSQIVAHVSAERLRVGDRLPTIRALAADLARRACAGSWMRPSALRRAASRLCTPMESRLMPASR